MPTLICSSFIFFSSFLSIQANSTLLSFVLSSFLSFFFRYSLHPSFFIYIFSSSKTGPLTYLPPSLNSSSSFPPTCLCLLPPSSLSPTPSPFPFPWSGHKSGKANSVDNISMFRLRDRQNSLPGFMCFTQMLSLV